MSVNKVILLGRVGNEPEVKYMPSGNAVLNLSIATNRKIKNQESDTWEDKTEWHRVVFFNKPAEIVSQYVKKGQQLYVEGRLQTRKWQDKDGIEKYSTDIISDNFTFVGSKSDNLEEPTKTQQPPSNEKPVEDHSPQQSDDMDVPF
ncbi:MAG: single-stranded DNA-binding protein [Gammaproteobacteria bacterium]|nr:single-stranded DNA-binding protein [Gammaproteobacteria bacterium]|tara:strand:- start:191 stop:628 length:438 start_codon:yes stop_codon:yes gene_type:complete